MQLLLLPDYAQSPAPLLKPRVASQLVPLLTQTMLAAPAATVGVSMMVRPTGGLAVLVAPVVTVITPLVTEVTTVTFFVTRESRYAVRTGGATSEGAQFLVAHCDAGLDGGDFGRCAGSLGFGEI